MPVQPPSEPNLDETDYESEGQGVESLGARQFPYEK
jgi:hypothetical protein